MDAGPQKHEYFFSAGTVSRAVDYYKSVSSKPYRTEGPTASAGFYQWYLSAPQNSRLAEIVDKLPPWLRAGRSFGMARWKWPFLILASAVAGSLMTIAYWLYPRLTAKVRQQSLLKYWITLALPIFATWVPLGFLDVVRFKRGVRGDALYVIAFLSLATALVGAIVVVFAATTRIAETIIASPRVNPLGLNAHLIRITSKLVGATAALALVLYGGQFLAIPVKRGPPTMATDRRRKPWASNSLSIKTNELATMLSSRIEFESGVAEGRTFTVEVGTGNFNGVVFQILVKLPPLTDLRQESMHRGRLQVST